MQENLISKKLNDVLLALHGGCRSQTVERFRDWALELIRPLIAFDGAQWGSGVWVDGAMHFFDSHVYRIDPDYARRLGESIHLDKGFFEVVANPGRAFARDGYENPEFRRQVLDPFGLRYALLISQQAPSIGVFDGIGLVRKPESGQFSETNRLCMETLAPHLHQARMVNQIERTNDVLDAGLRASYHSLVSSNDGLVVAAEPEATALLLREWPDWRGGRLPPILVEAIVAATANRQATGLQRRHFSARINPSATQALVRLRVPNVIDTLGRRELTVAERFATGASYKEIAQALDLSPSTVSNQLTVIYTKLGISNKSELLQLLERWR
jgi:DNA-binding NarL/FixJ family response regulator